MKRIKRNKNCSSCPQNKREDIVWRKGFEDGEEVANANFKKLFWKFYWGRWR